MTQQQISTFNWLLPENGKLKALVIETIGNFEAGEIGEDELMELLVDLIGNRKSEMMIDVIEG